MAVSTTPKISLTPLTPCKDWVFEAVWWIYDKFDVDKRRFVTEPNQVSPPANPRLNGASRHSGV